jgi:aminopeptidase N
MPVALTSAGEEETLVRSTLSFTRTAAGGEEGVASPPLELSGSPEIALRSLSLNGTPLGAGAYSRTPKGGLLLHAPLPDGGPFTLQVETACKPQDNTSLEGLYKSSGALAAACCHAAAGARGVRRC